MHGLTPGSSIGGGTDVPNMMISDSNIYTGDDRGAGHRRWSDLTSSWKQYDIVIVQDW